MKHYAVAQLARLAGVSVRTLHLYDRIGLLTPAHRSPAGYRSYGAAELLRLQQILFYKEIGLSLQEIAAVLDDPGFDLIRSLEGHKAALQQKRQQIDMMLATVDNTLLNLKENIMPQHEELYEGLTREEARAYHKEAIERFGQETVERSVQHLKQMTKAELDILKTEQKDILRRFTELQNEDPESDAVQEVTARHYHNIRRFWGTDQSTDKQAKAYKGLTDLYINDERFLQTENGSQPRLAILMKKAIAYFADHQLK